MAFGKFAVDYEERINFDRLRRERLERAQRQIAEDGYGAIVTFNADNIRYITSQYITTPLRAGEYQFTVCPRKGGPTLFSGVPEETSRRMPWLNGKVRADLGSAPSSADKGVDNPTLVNQVNAIIECLEEAGVKGEPIGIDGTTLSAHYIEAFAKRGITCKICKTTMDKARMIKTVDEIAIMKMVSANTEFAFAAIADAIRPGIKECDLVGIGIKTLYEQGCDHTEDLVCM